MNSCSHHRASPYETAKGTSQTSDYEPHTNPLYILTHGPISQFGRETSQSTLSSIPVWGPSPDPTVWPPSSPATSPLMNTHVYTNHHVSPFAYWPEPSHDHPSRFSSSPDPTTWFRFELNDPCPCPRSHPCQKLHPSHLRNIPISKICSPSLSGRRSN